LEEQYTEIIALQSLKEYQFYKYIGVIGIPIVILLRSSFFALILSVIYQLDNIDLPKNDSKYNKYTFKHFWFIFICCEWIWLFFLIIKFIWFGYFYTDYNYVELINFNILSIYDFMKNIVQIDNLFIYTLKSASLQELSYILTLACAIYYILDVGIKKSIIYVFYSYGLPIILFHLIIISINFLL
jgi:hypothetical protein